MSHQFWVSRKHKHIYLKTKFMTNLLVCIKISIDNFYKAIWDFIQCIAINYQSKYNSLLTPNNINDETNALSIKHKWINYSSPSMSRSTLVRFPLHLMHIGLMGHIKWFLHLLEFLSIQLALLCFRLSQLVCVRKSWVLLHKFSPKWQVFGAL